MKYVIGIDLGTSATKTVLFDETGTKVASASEEYPMSQPHNGWAEQNPEDWVTAAIHTLKDVVAKARAEGIAAEDIVSLGISGQMHGLVMLDRWDHVLRPAILWCDQRTGKECEELSWKLGVKQLIDITANPALTGFTASKILWVKNNEPQNFAACSHILLPKDYLRFRLTGDFATEVSDASGMQLLDVPRRRWSPVMLEALGLREDQLPKVYESPDVTGTLLPDVAEMLGLLPTTLVVGGAGDNAAAAVGTGIVEEGKAFTTIGTSGVVFAHTDRPVIDPKGRVHTFCCAVPGCWHVMGVTQGAGLSLNWFKEQFCAEELAEAERTGGHVYSIMDQEAADIPIGADRLLYLPYLMGERTPHLDPDCRGVFFGISARHTRAHFIRAVMEGVTYSLCDCLDILQEMDIRPDTMLVTGGGGTSALWREMLCDSFGIPVQTMEAAEGPALGVAILAAVGAGLYASVPEACNHMVRYSPEKQLPLRANTEIYATYHKVYQKLYSSLQSDFSALAKL